MTVVGLYAGIGGFELGFHKAGFETALLADKDEHCRTVLKGRFEGVDVRSDVATIRSLPEGTSLVTAGFPCQNLSMAGDKVGLGGHKTSDVRHMFQLLARGERPTLAIENVYFLLHVAKGNAMRELVETIEELGYDWAYRVVNTLAFGLPQRRRRVFFVASKTTDPRTVLFADEAGAPPEEVRTLNRPLGFYWTEGAKGVGFAIDAIPPLKIASTVGIPSTPAVLFPNGEVLALSIEACEKVQGFEAGWTDFEFGLRRSPRWSMVGNAVSVPASEWLAKRLMSPGKLADLDERPVASTGAWPSAAYGIDRERRAVTVSEYPLALPRPSIESFRDENWRPLSKRALNGFIGRALAGGLKMPEGFLDALGRAAQRQP